jgi:hypothetical protein
MFYFFINMLGAFQHTILKSKFVHAYIQPYGFFRMDLYISFQVDIVFYYI